MKFHKVCEVLPMMEKQEYSELVDDIKRNGLLEPIWVYKDKVVDGRNRYNACVELGIKPDFREWDGSGSLVSFVISLNLKRRHLTGSQKAAVAIEMLPWMEKEAKKRQKATLPKKGQQGFRVSEKIPQHESGKATEQAAKIVGTNPHYVSDAKVIKEKAPDKFEEMKTGQKTISQVKREINKEERAEKVVSLPSDKYRVIYADPPWKYGSSGLDQYGPAERHYTAMSIKELCSLEVEDLVEDDAVLFLWVTSPLLFECEPIIKAWGFKYKTSFVWDKVKHNFGHYNSVRHEFLLVCTRGSCTPEVNKLYDSVQEVEKTKKHSEKPEQFRNIIDALYPSGKRIELFARKQIKNWDVWGLESNK